MPRKRKELSYDNPNSIFFQAFIGEFCEIRLRAPNIRFDHHSLPSIEVGFLLDLDENHFYLSDDAQIVSCAVKRADYLSIKIVPEDNLVKEALDTVEIPDKPEEGN